MTTDVRDEPALWTDVGAERAQEEASPEVERTLRAVFERNYASVYRLLRRFGVPVAQLDDAAQEVFWVAARRLLDIAPDRERAFLYGVALRVAAGEARKSRGAPPLFDPDVALRIVDPRPNPEEHLEKRQARALLDVALDRLPLPLRTVFVLAELEHLELREIAELEGLPLGTANSRLRRAREEFSAIAARIRAAIARGARL
ncbi:MAG TPA: sigma-70 family RNA polymerase sigma factor [Polyangiaceae bacterium]|nr:sigma-70 family RNA polymerase sigma factor [Polyangiaceae bacterium]